MSSSSENEFGDLDIVNSSAARVKNSWTKSFSGEALTSRKKNQGNANLVHSSVPGAAGEASGAVKVTVTRAAIRMADGDSQPAQTDQHPQNIHQKTEATNPYFQFLKSKREELLRANPNGVLNLDLSYQEWQFMSDEDKNPFVLKTAAEKEELKAKGVYRKNRRNKAKNQEKSGKVIGKKAVKKVDKQKLGVKDKNVMAEREPTITELIKTLEEQDEMIDGIEIIHEEIDNEMSSVNSELYLKKYILESKTKSCNDFYTKYTDLLNKHTSCYNTVQ